MIYSEDCLPGSFPLGISKHEKLLLQLYTVHVVVVVLVVVDHWMTLLWALQLIFTLEKISGFRQQSEWMP